MANRTSGNDGSFGEAAPLGAPPKGPHPSGAAGVLCELAQAGHSPIVSLTRALCDELLFGLCRAGRLFGIRDGAIEQLVPLSASDAPDWELVLVAQPASARSTSVLFSARLKRRAGAGEESLAVTRVDAMLETGFVVVGAELGRLPPEQVSWLKRLWREPLEVAAPELPEFLGALCALPGGPRFENVEDLGYELRAPKPRPVLRLKAPEGGGKFIAGELTFRYPRGKTAAGGSPEAGTIELGGEQLAAAHVGADRSLLCRDYAEENTVFEALRVAGFEITRWRSDTKICPFEVRVHFDAFVRACEDLLGRGFVIEVEGAAYRRPSRWRTLVRSDQDWFEVRGAARFEAQEVELPRLLEAVRKRERFVRLGDGSYGVLPEKWLAELEPFALLVSPKNAALRFHAAQALMFDGLLSGTWAPELDPGFAQLRQRLLAFRGAKPLGEPTAFQGTLRGYQRTALGWLRALVELGLGGCLADDMGLGKTVVVLAWLLHRRQEQSERLPSLIVVPRSLLFNWKAESARFAPSLRVLAHHGAARKPPGRHFSEYDVVLTSYGTLRRDARALSQQSFDYVILDEAQSIKNEYTDTHRAARALSSRYRLALAGTPLENHVSELWSLMLFLNPGVFEHLRHLRKTFERKQFSQTALRESIYRVVRPFILRRTKQHAAPELPARIEQTVYVELGAQQRRAYRELANHYRARILERKELRRQHGPNRYGNARPNGSDAAKALEALLRLRQVACHPALLDNENATSAKLDVLIPKLAALQDEGHKSLIFSQFTGLLCILRKELDRAGIAREYLDGQVTNRERVVARFSERPGGCAFLISLKTGGVGLNLTAADYVFILDPWWNPAAEAQAIDRAHRIGQTKPVIAYRILAEDTVEAKVAALQARKGAVTEALFGDSEAFAGALRREDLEFLLGE